MSNYYRYNNNNSSIIVNTSKSNAINFNFNTNNNNNNNNNLKSQYDQEKQLYHSIERTLSILPVILMIAGTLGNSIAFYVLTRKKLRSQSTMLYFASLTVMDTISLYQWNFNFFYKYRLNSENQNLEDQSLFLCRYVSFMAYFSMQTSAWILTIISIDRYLIITNNIWKQKFSRNIRFNLFVILTIITIFALVNMPVVFFNGKLTSYRITNFSVDHLVYLRHRLNRKVECYTTKFIIFWQRASLALECLFPLILMIVFNYLLIKRTYKSSTRLNLTQNNTNANAKNKHKLLPKSVSMNGNLAPDANNKHHLDSSNLELASTNSATGPSVVYKNKNHFASSIFLSEIPNYQIHEASNGKLFSPLIHNYSKLRKKFKSYDNSINKLYNQTNHAPKLDDSEKEHHQLSQGVDAKCKNKSTSNLVYNHSTNNLNEPNANPTFLSASNVFNVISTNNLSSTYRNSSGDTGKSLLFLSESYRSSSSKKYFLNSRNRRIVLMLSLLTLSFTISTLPSAIFYTFFRPIINDKPYKRLLTMSFNLLRHLSHTFNFVIYFTSSSVIKQQLKEIFNQNNLKTISLSCILNYLKYWFCCLCCCLIEFKKTNVIGHSNEETTSKTKNAKKKNTSFNLKNSSDDEHSEMSNTQIAKNGEFRMKIYKLRHNSLLSIEPSLTNNNNNNNIKYDIDDSNIDDIDEYYPNTDPHVVKSNFKVNNLNVPKLMLNSKNISNAETNCAKPYWF